MKQCKGFSKKTAAAQNAAADEMIDKEVLLVYNQLLCRCLVAGEHLNEVHTLSRDN